MDNAKRMQVSKCQGNIVAEAELNVTTQLMESCQAVIHQLHEQNWLVGSGFLTQPQVLDNIRMLDIFEALAFLEKLV